jgi:hypothetical protein
VLSGRGLCDGPITRPEESYRLWCGLVCDLETSRMRRLKPASGLQNPVKEERRRGMGWYGLDRSGSGQGQVNVVMNLRVP